MASEDLCKEDLLEMKELFKLFDKDDDEKISSVELRGILKKLHSIDATDEEIELMINEVDADRNGAIDFPEFLDMMKPRILSCKDEQMREAFEEFDKDGDGLITADELFDTMCALDADVTIREVQKMIKDADMDGDGQVNFEEFKGVMKKIRG